MAWSSGVHRALASAADAGLSPLLGLPQPGREESDDVDELVESGVRAFIMGTRRGDPYADKLGFYSPSSPGWPPFMRVHPVLEWDYGTVWDFLRSRKLAYCKLYDMGYTSVGQVHNTKKNPALLEPDGVTYRPAFTLAASDFSAERGGRPGASGGGQVAPEPVAAEQ